MADDVKKTCSTCRICAEIKTTVLSSTLLVTGMWTDTMVSSGKLSVFVSSPRICLIPNERLSFQMLCIPSDRSSRHRQTTPHERFFSFQRRSSCGTSMPSWLHSPGPVLLRRFARTSKRYPLMDQVELRDVNPMYANVRYKDRWESTVSLRVLAPCPSVTMDATKYSQAVPSEIV